MVGVTVYEFRSNPRQSAAKVETAGANTTIRPRRAVAVLGFRNLAGRPDDNWLSTAFTEMLSTELAAGGSLRLVPGEDVARAKRELPLADEDTLARSTLERLRTNPGADVVVLGSYTLLPGRTKIASGSTYDCRTRWPARPLPNKHLTGSEYKLFELAAQAGSELRQSLGASVVSGKAITPPGFPALESGSGAVVCGGPGQIVGIRFSGRARPADQSGCGRSQLSPDAFRTLRSLVAPGLYR